LGSTLTTAVALFPFLYLQGNARAAFVPFASAFLLALAWSVFMAIGVVPSLSGRHVFKVRRWGWGRRVYARAVGWTLRVRWLTLGLTVVTLAGLSGVFVAKVPRFAWGGGYGQQRTTLSVYLSFPRGSDPQAVDEGIAEFEQITGPRPEIEQMVAQGDEANAQLQIVFTNEGAVTPVPAALQEALTQRAVFIGGASISVQGQGPGFAAGSGGGTSSTFRIKVLGYSYSGVERLALDLKNRLEQIPRVRDVNLNVASLSLGGQRGYQVTLEPDRNALARFGVTPAQFGAVVSREMRSNSSEVPLEIGGEETPVLVKAEGARDRSLDELRDALVPNALRSPVRVGDLARIGEKEALAIIQREDQQYIRILSYDFRGPPKLAVRTHDAFMKSIAVPPGYTVAEQTHSWSGADSSDKGLWLVLAIGVALVILAVALVFDSVWAAVMVFLSLPMPLGGVFAAFWIFKAAFTREAAVGVILVVGLSVHQAILLVDAALWARTRRDSSGGSKSLDAGAVVRAALDRSGMIIVVTMSALASLLPLSIGTPTTSLFGAIALAAAGGTVAGTIGTLFIVPAMLMGRRGTRPKGRSFRWLGSPKLWRRKSSRGKPLRSPERGVA
jgi:multidrug efflux pump subunit AcrB